MCKTKTTRSIFLECLGPFQIVLLFFRVIPWWDLACHVTRQNPVIDLHYKKNSKIQYPLLLLILIQFEGVQLLGKEMEINCKFQCAKKNNEFDLKVFCCSYPSSYPTVIANAQPWLFPTLPRSPHHQCSPGGFPNCWW